MPSRLVAAPKAPSRALLAFALFVTSISTACINADLLPTGTDASVVIDADIAAPDQAIPEDASTPFDATASLDASQSQDGTSTDLFGAPTRLRLVAANLTSGNSQAYDLPGIHILQGLRPDIVMLQEWNYGGNSDAEIRDFVDTTFGRDFVYYREAAVQIPNGIVSRYPILQSGDWDDPTISNREFAWARIDVPGPRDLWAVSVHLSTTSTNRPVAAAALVAAILANVPAADLLVIGGDLNTSSRGEAALTTLSQVTSTLPPWPVDQIGNGNTNSTRARPYDWVLFDPDLAALAAAVEIGASRYPDGLVFDSRVYTPLYEAAPVLSTDSAAANMQHMAVARDALLP